MKYYFILCVITLVMTDIAISIRVDDKTKGDNNNLKPTSDSSLRKKQFVINNINYIE
jgi:hypothetical protein